MPGPIIAPAAQVSAQQKISAPAGIRYRTSATGPIQAGGKTAFALSVGNKIRFLALRLMYTLTQPASAIAIAPANIAPGDEFGLLQQLQIFTSDNDYILSASAMELLAVWNRLLPRRKPVYAPLKNAGATSPVIDSTLVIPFWMLNANNHVETELNTTRLLQGQLTALATWGNVGNVCTIAGMTLGGALQAEIRALEAYGAFTPLQDLRFTKINLLGVAPGVLRQKTPVPVATNLDYFGFIVHEYNSGTNPVTDQPGVLSRLSFKSGETAMISDCNLGSLRQQLWQTAPQFTTDGDAEANAESFLISSLTNYDAWTYVPYSWDGYKTEDFSTAGLTDLHFEYDVAAGVVNPAVDVYGIQILKA